MKLEFRLNLSIETKNFKIFAADILYFIYYKGNA